MRKVFNSFVVLLVLAALAKILMFILWFYIDGEGVELEETKNYKPQYHRIDFRAMIEKEKKVQVKKQKPQKSSNNLSITNMILKGLYGKSNYGFAVIALKSSPKKTSIISVGEVFSGYTLSYIYQDSVVFVKNAKEYTLELKNLKNKKNENRVKKYKEKSSSSVVEIDDDEDLPRDVLRSDIAYYSKHPQEIWRNISIHEVKKRGKIIGFKVTKINKKSVFARLGLKKGDLIVSANNIELNSYKSALDLYNKIDSIYTMQIVVIRNNQEKELIYEIR